MKSEPFVYSNREREPITSLETYMRWYWNITRRYVLKALVQAVSHNPYTPRAPLERNVADGIHKALETTEKLEQRFEHDVQSKGTCLNIKYILRAVLGRNRVERSRLSPPSPPPANVSPPPIDIPPLLLAYTRRNKKGEGTSFEGGGLPSEQLEYIYGPSQPTCTIDPSTEIDEEEYMSQPLERCRTSLKVRHL